jgi:hypothetical protein
LEHPLPKQVTIRQFRNWKNREIISVENANVTLAVSSLPSQHLP